MMKYVVLGSISSSQAEFYKRWFYLSGNRR